MKMDCNGELQYYLGFVNQSVDKEEWPVNILESNAQHRFANNAICMIGHEISHAYDPQGAQYDENGNVADWWTEEDYEEFERRAAKNAEWFDQVIAFDDGEDRRL